MLIRKSLNFSLALIAILAFGIPVAGGTLDEEVQGVAGDIVASLGEDGPTRVAVLDFYDVRGYRSALDAYLAEELTTALALAAGTGEITLIERRQLTRVLEEQQLSSSEVFDEQSLNQVGQLLGVDALISGSLTILESEVRVHVRALSVSSGAILTAARMSLNREELEALLQQPVDATAQNSVARTLGGRPAQHPDSFFQNRYIRLTVASVGRSESGRQVTIALTMENLTSEVLRLAAPISNSKRCYIHLIDNRGNEANLSYQDVGGLPCAEADELERFGQLTPGSQTTVVLAFRSSAPFGDMLSLGMELYIAHGDRQEQPARIMAGISGIRHSAAVR